MEESAAHLAPMDLNSDSETPTRSRIARTFRDGGRQQSARYLSKAPYHEQRAETARQACPGRRATRAHYVWAWGKGNKGVGRAQRQLVRRFNVTCPFCVAVVSGRGTCPIFIHVSEGSSVELSVSRQKSLKYSSGGKSSQIRFYFTARSFNSGLAQWLAQQTQRLGCEAGRCVCVCDGEFAHVRVQPPIRRRLALQAR